MNDNAATPTVQLDTQFLAPSFLADHLNLSLVCTHLDQTSAKFQITARCGDQKRFVANQAIVHVGSDFKPLVWPQQVRERFQNAT